jgi:hypothetical protein
MKRFNIGLVALCLCVLSLPAFAADMGASVDQLSAHEKMLWESIKTGDMKAFAAGVADDLMDVDASGVIYNKQQLIDALGKQKVNDYKLSDFSVFTLDKECVVLTYKTNLTATMGNKMMNMNLIEATTYVNNGGKWLPKFHSETVIPETGSM